ncbi:hypothetical protein [Oceanobacillus senegalensis]|uniref:hypothetical protein n=1 Tax=Oceanobacillus senegalensis TaxID=1936063 RepID=UPI000A30A8E9|nr:hypothetical protein [Oceanobacillus senegalensis]
MNTYVRNYWSLYLDFIRDFEKLKYKGFSLSYIVHFPSLIRHHTEVWNALYHEKFMERLKSTVNNQKTIQGIFNKYVQSHQKKQIVKKKHGKVMIHLDGVLRLPPRTFYDYFNKRSMIISSGVKRKSSSPSTMYNIPVKYLNDYKMDTKKAIFQLQKQAKSLFYIYRGHHLYKDKTFQSLLLKKIKQLVNGIEQSHLLLDEVSTSCVIVSTTHSYINRILVLVAAEKGIPSICVQHGIIGNEFGFIPKIATVDAVYGQFEVDWYKQRGALNGSCEIIGHPRFDQAFQPPTISKNTFFKQLGLDKSKKTLLIAVRGNKNIDKWRMLIKTVTKQVDLNILIKDYPVKTPHQLTREFSFVHSTQSFNLYDILPQVDCVVTYPSTVGLEAMIANRAVFILHRNIPNYSGYYNNLGELVQLNPQNLGNLIINYFNDSNWVRYFKKEREKFLQYAYPDMKKSGERLKQLIDRLTN